MTDPADRYLRPVQRDSTVATLSGRAEVFRAGVGACLPASGATVVRYLVEHAETLSSSTLGLHLGRACAVASRPRFR